MSFIEAVHLIKNIIIQQQSIFYKTETVFTVNCLDTPLGSMCVIADSMHLYLLSFILGYEQLDKAINGLVVPHKAILSWGETVPLIQIRKEIERYFLGKQRVFTTPFKVCGTPFQQKAWAALMDVSYGETCSYLMQARCMGRPRAYRAVANANGANRLSLRLPCHRIIHHHGGLGGYGAGLERKKWLLNHEKKHQ